MLTLSRQQQYKLLISISDSTYPPFWVVPIVTSISIVLGVVLAVFWMPFLLLGVFGFAGFAVLFNWQQTLYEKLYKEPDFVKIETQIHKELKEKYRIKDEYE